MQPEEGLATSRVSLYPTISHLGLQYLPTGDLFCPISRSSLSMPDNRQSGRSEVVRASGRRSDLPRRGANADRVWECAGPSWR